MDKEMKKLLIACWVILLLVLATGVAVFKWKDITDFYLYMKLGWISSDDEKAAITCRFAQDGANFFLRRLLKNENKNVRLLAAVFLGDEDDFIPKGIRLPKLKTLEKEPVRQPDKITFSLPVYVVSTFGTK